MPVQDLREWIERMEAIGEVRVVSGAHWDRELGAIADLYQRKPGSPALLFDKIPGYPDGCRVLVNALTSMRRIAFSLELQETNRKNMVLAWRERVKKLKPLPVQVVNSSPVFSNLDKGDKVNLWKLPAPRWHEHDGNRYVGTGCLVIMRDPETGWVNYGCYRVAVHDERTAGIYISPGKHGRLIRDKYWAKGEACPVAVCLGQDPLLFMCAGIEVPYGVSELEYAGGIRGEPVTVVSGPVTGLPIPAQAEAVIEGYIPPGEQLDEGPFGEWTGYYASGRQPAPVIHVEAVMYRDNPILLGSIPGVPPTDTTYYRSILRSALVWDQLESAGVPGIAGVWAHEAGASRMMLTVSIKQQYPGHSRQAGLIASQCHAGAYANRLVIVVDDDVDPSDTFRVIWALCTRTDPKEDVEILQKCWSTPLDPMAYGSQRPVYNSRIVIDACRPFDKLSDFPPVAEVSPDYARQIMEKWADLFPNGQVPG